MKNYVFIVLLTIAACKSKDVKPASSTISTDTNADTGTVSKASVDTVIVGERIDGPANVRDTVNGRILFTINDNTVVTANIPQNKWLQVGVFADLTKEEKDSQYIKKGSKIFVDGKEVGEAKADIPLRGAISQSNEGVTADLVGFTSASNIKVNTVPENILSKIVNEATGPLTLDNFKKFLKDFAFNDFDGLIPAAKGYELDENWIDDPSPLLRLWLVFKDNQLLGIFHSRTLKFADARPMPVDRDFYFTPFTHDEKTKSELVRNFNSFIRQVD